MKPTHKNKNTGKFYRLKELTEFYAMAVNCLTMDCARFPRKKWEENFEEIQGEKIVKNFLFRRFLLHF